MMCIYHYNHHQPNKIAFYIYSEIYNDVLILPQHVLCKNQVAESYALNKSKTKIAYMSRDLE